jgi:DNA polymerase III subunit gamma/tau
MDHFIVSARKYRPATFREVVGQDSITRTLKNAIQSGQLAQAFLFTGPRGVGKTTCARIMAKTINCLAPTADMEPCNQCESCTSFNTTASFNIHELDAASNNSVDDIRSLVDQVRIPPQAGKYKVYIIDEVHMLSTAAFNAFLKTLEEPPAYAKFILATTEKHKIIPTILSRCQVYDFQRIRTEDISKHLAYVANAEHVEFELEALHVIARKADGALRDALSIFDQLVSFAGEKISYKDVIQNLNVLDQDYYFKLIDMMLEGDNGAVLMLVEDVVARGFDGHHFIAGIGEHLRNLLMCKDIRTVELIEASESTRQQYSRQATACESITLVKALAIQNRCDLDYKNSSNKRILLELSLLQMSTIFSPPTNSEEKKKTSSVIPQTAKEERRTESPSVPDPESLPDSISAKPASDELNQGKKHADLPVQASPAPSPSSPKPPSTSSFTPSIRSALENKKRADETIVKTESEAVPPQPSNFTLEQFMEVWNRWLREIEHDQPSLVTGLRMNVPEILENSQIRVKLQNAILFEAFQENRFRLQERLRNKLSNQSITLQPEIIENQESRKPYTNREKFLAMAEMNRNLLTLKDTFDLDID